MKRTAIQRKTPLSHGTKRLTTRKRLRTKTRLRQVNPERKAKRAEEQWGPGGAAGDYAVILRARPCDTCGRGRSVSLPNWEAVERLRQSVQSEISHVTGRGTGGKWWEAISQCNKCHTAGPRAVHGLGLSGWGNCRGLALLLAQALAWAAVDAGVVPPDRVPECSRPELPKGTELSAVKHYSTLLRLAWAGRHDTEES